jgi:ABC-type Fe3+ transport system substrate-binding protein
LTVKNFFLLSKEEQQFYLENGYVQLRHVESKMNEAPALDERKIPQTLIDEKIRMRRYSYKELYKNSKKGFF